jgi:hypothetical protein
MIKLFFIYKKRLYLHKINNNGTIKTEYILKNNELSGEKINSIVHDFKNTVDMSAYDFVLKEAKLEGKLEGLSLKEREVITKILLEFPKWEDEKIADLASADVTLVKNIRKELFRSES